MRHFKTILLFSLLATISIRAQEDDAEEDCVEGMSLVDLIDNLDDVSEYMNIAEECDFVKSHLDLEGGELDNEEDAENGVTVMIPDDDEVLDEIVAEWADTFGVTVDELMQNCTLIDYMLSSMTYKGLVTLGEDCECMNGGMWEYGEKTDPETGEMVQYMMAQSDDDDGMVYILEPDSTSFTCGDDSDEMGDEETDDGDDGTTDGNTRRHILKFPSKFKKKKFKKNRISRIRGVNRGFGFDYGFV